MFSAIGMCVLAAQLAVATPATPVTAVAAQRGLTASVEAESSRSLTLINSERAQEGLSPLKWNERLAKTAQRHADLLARNRQLSHQFTGEAPLQQRLAGVGLRFGKAGENVAVNLDAQSAHLAFMHSSGHRANILNPDFNEVGVAAVSDGDLLYFVEDFVQQRAIISNTDAARALVGRFEEIARHASLPHLLHVQDTRVQDWACAVAKDPSNAARGSSVFGARFALAYSAAEPDELPGNIEWLKNLQPGDRYTIGVCFSRSSQYSTGRYFTTIAFFDGAPYSASDQRISTTDPPLTNVRFPLQGRRRAKSDLDVEALQ
jgi:uncharacterized protein YkwD